MPERLKGSNKVVGTRRVLRAIDSDLVRIVYIAQDADLFISRQVLDRCREKNLPVVEVDTMKRLGQACGIQVPSATAAILTDAT